MGEVVILGGHTRLPIPVERVLDGAKGSKYVLVISLDENEVMHVAASEGDMYKAVYLASRFVHKEMNGDYTDES